MDSIVILAGIVFVPEIGSKDLVAYHRGDCEGLQEEVEGLGYKLKVEILVIDVIKYIIKEKL